MKKEDRWEGEEIELDVDGADGWAFWLSPESGDRAIGIRMADLNKFVTMVNEAAKRFGVGEAPEQEDPGAVVAEPHKIWVTVLSNDEMFLDLVGIELDLLEDPEVTKSFGISSSFNSLGKPEHELVILLESYKGVKLKNYVASAYRRIDALGAHHPEAAYSVRKKWKPAGNRLPNR